jgi:hypothetical protein
VVDRHERAVESAFIDGDRGSALALDGEFVAVLAGEAFQGGDEIGGDALRHHRELLAQVQVVRMESVDVQRRGTRHRLHSARDDEILEA